MSNLLEAADTRGISVVINLDNVLYFQEHGEVSSTVFFAGGAQIDLNIPYPALRGYLGLS